MSMPARRAVLGSALAIALGFSGAACGSSSSKDSGTTSGNGLEKSTVTVGMMTIADDVSLQIAQQKGLFKAEGLTVKLSTISGGAEAVPKLKSGALDISFGNYLSFMTAEEKNVLKPSFVANAFTMAKGTHAIVVPADSPIKTLADLKGKKIGVNTKHAISALFVRAAVKPLGFDLDDDKNFVEIPPPNWAAALKAKTVDAVQAIEPFVTQLRSDGNRVVADLSQGEVADFPVAGYVSTQSFVAKNPKTIAAFQRAIAKAQALAADHSTIQAVLPTYTKISSQVAATMAYGAYPTALDATALQRVADIGQKYGYLPSKLDVKTLLSTGTS